MRPERFESLPARRAIEAARNALPTELKRRLRNFYESLGLPLAEKGICALPAWVLRLCDESCRFRRLPATQRTELAWPFGCRPPWPNGQGVGLLIRRLWVRPTGGVLRFLKQEQYAELCGTLVCPWVLQLRPALACTVSKWKQHAPATPNQPRSANKLVAAEKIRQIIA